MKIVGIDLGSRSVKIVVFEDDNMKESSIIDTAKFYREYCSSSNGEIEIDFEKLNLNGFDQIISTGYGRNNVNVSGGKKIVELKAHLYGAIYTTGLRDFVLLDVGGQDSKIILVDGGKMKDILLNDKCAASCGRYLENMSNVLGLKLSEMTRYSSGPVKLNSTCAIFSESELIGKISEGVDLPRLAAGVNYSLYKRIQPKLASFRKDTLVVTGGVAKNSAFINFIKEEGIYKNVIVPRHTQLNGAIGCCVWALGKV
ncbi:MAG: 2-hydroxyglutaryl-CoA dehydratase [Clostridiales bacterium]|nr:2-hydroxyglutaryl-CoA dehydratase [Clostridiales bacterium]